MADNAEKNIAESNDEHRDFLKDDNGGGSAEEQDKGRKTGLSLKVDPFATRKTNVADH